MTVFNPNSPLQPAVRLRSSLPTLNLEFAPCHLELDPTLTDRLHRTFDALEVSSVVCEIIKQTIDEASGLGNMEYDSGKVRKWLCEDHDSVCQFSPRILFSFIKSIIAICAKNVPVKVKRIYVIVINGMHA